MCLKTGHEGQECVYEIPRFWEKWKSSGISRTDGVVCSPLDENMGYLKRNLEEALKYQFVIVQEMMI